MPPGSDFALGKQPYVNSWSSDEKADEDGLYYNWSAQVTSDQGRGVHCCGCFLRCCERGAVR